MKIQDFKLCNQVSTVILKKSHLVNLENISSIQNNPKKQNQAKIVEIKNATTFTINKKISESFDSPSPIY